MANKPNEAWLYGLDPVPTGAQHFNALDDFWNYFRQQIGADQRSTLAVATDTLTPELGEHLVDTEASAATDDLANILATNIDPTRTFYLRLWAADPARVVTVKHLAGGAGQVSLADGQDFALDAAEKWILLQYRAGSATWFEITRSGAMSGENNLSEISDPVVARQNIKTPWSTYITQAPGDPDAGLDDDGRFNGFDCSTGPRTVTLDLLAGPPAIPQGVTMTLGKIDATDNALTIVATAPNVIDGRAQIVLNAPFESVTLMSRGDTWLVVARNGARAQEIQLRAGAWVPRNSPDGADYPMDIGSTPMNYTMVGFDYASDQFICFDWRPPKTLHPTAPIIADIECRIGPAATGLGVAFLLYPWTGPFPHLRVPTFGSAIGAGGDCNAVDDINQFRFTDLNLTGHTPGNKVALQISNNIQSGVWTVTGDKVYVNALNLTYYEMVQDSLA